MPVSDASVSALKKYLSIFAMAIAWRLHNRNWQNSKNSCRPCFPRSCARFSGGGLWYGGKAIPELQQAVRANPKDSETWGRWARRILRKAIAPMRWRIGKSPRPGSAQQQQRQMEQSVKVNRYWLAIQQGDAALKANILTGRNGCSSRHVMSITPTACGAGAGRCGDGTQRLPRR